MLPKDILKSGAKDFSVELSEENLEKFNTYCNFMLEYNEKVNLTAIKDPVEVAVKHFVDSLAVLKFVDMPTGCKLIDVGTGAGFPGVPLAIVRSDINLTLLDSLNKRLVFLEELSAKIDVKFKTVHYRAEQAGSDRNLREKFDFATSRAVGSLAVLCEYCLPLLKIGGAMIALKGPDCEAEIEQAQNAVEILGGGKLQSYKYTLPDTSSRTLIVIKKITSTPNKYPRQRVNLTERPL